jgi:D-arabinose 1-dehydrogenase-like Zn-dependent alcohol dehydrogenase
LTGLTGWRALVSKSGNAEEGRNILVTGIGGGVALNVLQFAVGKGCNVFVTSGSKEKIDKAIAMGAKGGVNYKDEGWEKELKKKLPSDRPYFDAVIDGAGGNVISKSLRLLRVRFPSFPCPSTFVSSILLRSCGMLISYIQAGGIVVQYGMTVAPKMDWSMPAVLNNLELRGSTMGSRKEFRDMIAFVNEKKIKPVVSRVVKGIDNMKEIDELFEEMQKGSQFGKLVIEIGNDGTSSKL